MGFTKITDEMMTQYPGVIGQATVPKLSVAEKQAKFEERAEKVLRPAHDKLVDELEASTAAADLGAEVPNGLTAEPKVQAILKALTEKVNNVSTSDGGKAPTNHASAKDTYGVGTGGMYGHVKLSDYANADNAVESGIAATPAALKKVEAGAAPKAHASSETDYGVGTGSAYGHLKLSSSTSNSGGVNDGTAATPAAVKAAYDLANGKVSKSGDQMTGALTTTELNVCATNSYPLIQLQTGNSATIGGLKGSGVTKKVWVIVKGTDSTYEDQYFFPTANAGLTGDVSHNILTDAKPVTVAQGGTNASTASEARTNLGVPPTSHASSAATYGVGTGSSYGHLKLSSSTSSTSGNSDGVAATPAAVKAAYDAATAAAAGLPAFTSGDGTRNSTNTTYASTQVLQWRKWGRVVTVNLYVRLAGTLNSETEYVTIASGFPAPPIVFKGFPATFESENLAAFVSINTSGEITLFVPKWQTIADGKGYVYGAFTYISAN